MLDDLDAGAMQTCASISISVLVGALVFSSVLELVKTSEAGKYSLQDAELRSSVRLVIALVQAVVLLSVISGIVSLCGIVISECVLRFVALVLTGGTSLLFAVLATVTIQRLWKRQS